MPDGTAARRGANLGTFAGVFTPSVLTILGLILFRRLGYVVGAGGTGAALLILGAATLISVLTSISLAAIATNLRAKGGGDYYLISRSLGLNFGGALGLVLFLAQSVSVAFYCAGLAEGLRELAPEGVFAHPRVVAAAAALFLFASAYGGADVATRLQLVIMAALGAGLLSFFAGAARAATGETFAGNWAAGAPGSPGFWPLFALFFPAVTGFTQGVSLSGDLKDPGRSLPAGTFLAVAVSTAVYAAAALLFGAALPAPELVSDYDAMSRVSWLPALVSVGLIAATLSSALASFLGAPRILQALAADRVFPLLDPFAAGHGPQNNPRRGVLLSLGIALLFIALGGINVIAPVVSMFFLISYGLLNYATAFEARAGSPSFRPRFRWFHYRASLLGAVGCLGAMLMINPWASAVALVLLFAIYQYVGRLQRPDRWADTWRDHYFQQMRENLLALAREPELPRHWRPRLLVFSDAPRRRDLLVRFASWIEGGAGLTTVARILEGHADQAARRCAEAEKELREDLVKRGIDAFPLAVAAPDLESAALTLLRAHGLGPLRPNTVLLNWLEREKETRRYARQLRAAVRLGVNVVVLDAKEEEWKAVEERPARDRRIDLWWKDDPSSRLMLLFAYMMTRTEEWGEAAIRVLAPKERRARGDRRSSIEETLEAFRIDADSETLEEWSAAALAERSRDASLVLLPLRLRRLEPLDPFGEPVGRLLENLPVAALVLAAEDIDLDAEPEEGRPEELVEAEERLGEARSRAENVRHRIEEARAKRAERLRAMEEARAALEAKPGEREKLLPAFQEGVEASWEAGHALKALEREAEQADRDIQAALRRAEELKPKA